MILWSGGKAQTLQLIDYANGNVIPDVLIYNLDRTKFKTTDQNGQADISEFSDGESMIFSHASYIKVVIKKRELISSGYTLELHSRVLNLDEYVISAIKRPEKSRETANRVQPISMKDIQLGQPQTAADAVAQKGGVYVQKSQLGGGSPMIRGFAANRVLISVDGVRMNNAIFRSGNLQNVISVDPLAIAKAEVLFGPSSLIYGSDALGGVMDFETLPLNYSESKKPKISGSALARYSSANHERTGHLDFSLGWKRWAWTSSFSASQFDDLLMGQGVGPDEYLRREYVETIDGEDLVTTNSNPHRQISSGFNQFQTLQKIGFRPNENIEFRYTMLYSTSSDIPRYDRLIQRNDEDSLQFATWHYGPQSWWSNNLTLLLNQPNGAFDNMKVNLGYQFFEESRMSRAFNNEERKNRIENVHMFTLNADFDNRISSRTTLFYGIESVVNLVGSEAYQESVFEQNTNKQAIQTRYPDGSTHQMHSAYINFKMNRDERNTISFGLRYNHVILHADFDTTFYPFPEPTLDINTGDLTGSVGIAHRPSENWQINGTLSSGFRAPNIDDAAKVFDSEPGRVIIPNTELRPETLYSLDFLISRQFGGPKPWLKAEWSGFFSHLVNAMVREKTTLNGADSIIYDGVLSEVQTISNSARATVYGTSFNIEVMPINFIKFTGALTWIDGNDDEGNPLRHVSPTFGEVHAMYVTEKITLDAYYLFNGEVSPDRMALSEQAKPDIYLANNRGELYSPSWQTLNVKGSWQLNKHFGITAGVENILDVRYRPYSSGIVAPGRNFIVSLRACL